LQLYVTLNMTQMSGSSSVLAIDDSDNLKGRDCEYRNRYLQV